MTVRFLLLNNNPQNLFNFNFKFKFSFWSWWCFCKILLVKWFGKLLMVSYLNIFLFFYLTIFF